MSLPSYVRVLALSLLGACAGRDTQVNAPSQDEHSCGGVGDPTRYESATEFVMRLAAIARGQVAGSLDAHVDQAFAARLPSNVTLASLFEDVPEASATQCMFSFVEEGGYSIVAIPPPSVDDTEEEAARIQAIIDVLSASTEVTAVCASTDPDEPRTLLYTIAVRRDDDGAFHALAWRDLRRETGHGD